jgi:hypothetical protein
MVRRWLRRLETSYRRVLRSVCHRSVSTEPDRGGCGISCLHRRCIRRSRTLRLLLGVGAEAGRRVRLDAAEIPRPTAGCGSCDWSSQEHRSLGYSIGPHTGGRLSGLIARPHRGVTDGPRRRGSASPGRSACRFSVHWITTEDRGADEVLSAGAGPCSVTGRATSSELGRIGSSAPTRQTAAERGVMRNPGVACHAALARKVVHDSRRPAAVARAGVQPRQLAPTGALPGASLSGCSTARAARPALRRMVVRPRNTRCRCCRAAPCRRVA